MPPNIKGYTIKCNKNGYLYFTNNKITIDYKTSFLVEENNFSTILICTIDLNNKQYCTPLIAEFLEVTFEELLNKVKECA